MMTALNPSSNEPVAHGGTRQWPLRIILLAGEREGAEFYVDALRGHGHSVAVAGDGRQALAAIPTFVPDILILDIGAPLMSAQETLERLRTQSSTPDLPVVILSDPDPSGELVRSLERLGIDAWVIKAAMMPEDLNGWLARWSKGCGLPVRGDRRPQPET
jgi:DNA-binding response OmpR family regulator